MEYICCIAISSSLKHSLLEGGEGLSRLMKYVYKTCETQAAHETSKNTLGYFLADKHTQRHTSNKQLLWRRQETT